MRVKLLSSGGFIGLGRVTFPVEVEAIKQPWGVGVSTEELERIGAEAGYFNPNGGWAWWMSEIEEVVE